MTGFEPQISDIGSNCSTNCATAIVRWKVAVNLKTKETESFVKKEEDTNNNNNGETINNNY